MPKVERDRKLPKQGKRKRSIYMQNQTPRKVEEPAKVAKPSVSINREEPAIETYDSGAVEYKSEEVVDKFTKYLTEYRGEFMDMILKHQASRTAISQIMEITTNEFGSPFVTFDEEFDEGIADVFKIMFFRHLITGLNKFSHSDAPIDVESVIRLLFFKDAQKPPESSSAPAVNKLRRDLSALVETLRKEAPAVGPYGTKGNSHDRSKH